MSTSLLVVVLAGEGTVGGVVHLKDIFIALQKQPDLATLKSLIRPIVTVGPPGSECAADVVGGLVINQLGNLPEEGLCIEFPLFNIVVKK